MMTYREKRKAAKQRDRLLGIGLIGGMVVLAIALVPLFAYLDCSRTKSFAAAYEDCIANEDCNPSSQQQWTYDRIGMELEFCRRNY